MTNPILSSRRLALFQALAQQQGLDNAQALPADRQARSGPAPLSFAQEGLWLLHQLNPEDPAYNEHFAIRLTGRIDESALEKSLNHVVNRHEVLRSRFKAVDGNVEASISDLFIPLDVEDLRFEEVDKLCMAMELASAEARLPFDLSTGPLLRAKIYRTGDCESLFLLVVHHIVIDGWSFGILVQEVTSAYEAFSRGMPLLVPDLPAQYSDFARWQRETHDEVREKAELEYWEQQLSGVLRMDLAVQTSSASRDNSAGRQSLVIDPLLMAKVKSVAQQSGLTIFMVWLAAFVSVLSRYTDQDDVVTGTVVSVRPSSRFEQLIGIFLNTVALRLHLNASSTFQELLTSVHKTCADTFAHQNVPFERVVQAVNPGYDRGVSPLFQTMFVFQEVPRLSLPELGTDLVDIHNGGAKFDLTLSVRQAADRCELCLEYRRAVFDDAAIKGLARHLLTLLHGAVHEAGQRILDLPLLTQSEQKQLLEEWNQTAARYPFSCMHELFEQQVERTPEATALVHDKKRLSYKELNRRANQLGHYLHKRGVGAEVQVGICMQRGAEMVVAMLGVLKAGGAYVPLDPTYPRERLQMMLENTQAELVVTQKQFEELLSESSAEKICMDERVAEIAEEGEANLNIGIDLQNLAYVIHTSGSTGRPKGVGIVHEGPRVLMHWARETFGSKALAGVLASTSICFDLSVFEIFVPLSWGGKVIVAAHALELQYWVQQEKITLINTVPSAMAELVRLKAIPESVRVVNLAGEAPQLALVKEIYGLGTVESVFNLYGPSEDTTYSTWSRIEKKKDLSRVDIGKPLAETQAYVLDQGMGLLPVGVAGELWLGGSGLARGYLNHPDLTAERFVPNPFSRRGGERLYRTGDEVRWTGEGKLEFVRRKDQQVKLRGYRIELGEIETLLREQQGVKDAVVMVSGEGNNQRLVANVVLEASATEEAVERGHRWTQLRAGLSRKLPQYMLPTEWIELEKVPMTTTGKVDRKALRSLGQPQILDRTTGREYVAARTPIEESLVTIWADVLKIDPPGVTDNFFELGGHSLLATQLISRVQKQFHVSLPMRQVFEQPTIENLSQYITSTGTDDGGPELVAVPRARYAVRL
jgi:amino acid adenylation domain-containing protein